eukprot:1263669-Rhodomonas_salina.1
MRSVWGGNRLRSFVPYCSARCQMKTATAGLGGNSRAAAVAVVRSAGVQHAAKSNTRPCVPCSAWICFPLLVLQRMRGCQADHCDCSEYNCQRKDGLRVESRVSCGSGWARLSGCLRLSLEAAGYSEWLTCSGSVGA